MARCLFIVQGEGKGHMSQALALKEQLDTADHSVESVLLGIRTPEAVPDYFREAFPGILKTFQSPWFLRTPNKKGIYVGRTLGYNLLRTGSYLRSISWIRREIERVQPDVIFNFYEMLGALAMRKAAPGIRTIGLGHHFYLYLNRSYCSRGPAWQRMLLHLHTRLILKSCRQVLALSFREESGSGPIQIIPPLVRREFREIRHVPGERYLVYFLQEGFLYDLVQLAGHIPGFQADVFTSLQPAMDIPDGIRLHRFDDEKFCKFMASCKGLITTAGFDSVAEAAYHGIPLAVVPSRNHLEQLCNAAETGDRGIGIHATQIDPGILSQMRAFDPAEYRRWADQAGSRIIGCLKE
jgi:uncharacterized protein (TIGR00661 family)